MEAARKVFCVLKYGKKRESKRLGGKKKVFFPTSYFLSSSICIHVNFFCAFLLFLCARVVGTSGGNWVGLSISSTIGITLRHYKYMSKTILHLLFFSFPSSIAAGEED